jgi:hypothetical protein
VSARNNIQAATLLHFIKQAASVEELSEGSEKEEPSALQRLLDMLRYGAGGALVGAGGGGLLGGGIGAYGGYRVGNDIVDSAQPKALTALLKLIGSNQQQELQRATAVPAAVTAGAGTGAGAGAGLGAILGALGGAGYGLLKDSAAATGIGEDTKQTATPVKPSFKPNAEPPVDPDLLKKYKPLFEKYTKRLSSIP